MSDQKKKFEERKRKVSEVLRNDPTNIVERMEELGFSYVVEDYNDDSEIAEENAAKPNNLDERYIVEYLEGKDPPTNDILSNWTKVTSLDEPNYPLFRRYFRDGNRQLKNLIIHGLRINPTDRNMLANISFFHIHCPILKEIIELYTKACLEAPDNEVFEDIVFEFDDVTRYSGYDAILALSELFKEDDEKVALLQKIICERNKVFGAFHYKEGAVH